MADDRRDKIAAGLARLVVIRSDSRAGVGFECTRNGLLINGWVEVTEEDRLVLVELHLHPRDREINSSALRAVPLGDLMAEVRQYLAAGPRVYVGEDGTTSGDVSRERQDYARRMANASAGPAERRGRAGYSEDFYRRVALAYLSFLSATPPVTRGILSAIAELAVEQEWFDDGRAIPTETVRSWVLQARKRDFLSGGEKGRAGAQPGPRLYDDSSRRQ